MSNFAKFMKQNKIQKENTFYPATKSLTDEEGNPLMWEIRPLTTKQDEDIRDVCTKEIPMQGRSNAYRPKFDANLYMNKLVVASTVCPDLYDAELQDSYGVKTPEELVKMCIRDRMNLLWPFVLKKHAIPSGMKSTGRTYRKGWNT